MTKPYAIRGYAVRISEDDADVPEYGIRCAVPECPEEMTAQGKRREAHELIRDAGWGFSSMGTVCPEHRQQIVDYLDNLPAPPSPDIARLIAASPSR